MYLQDRNNMSNVARGGIEPDFELMSPRVVPFHYTAIVYLKYLDKFFDLAAICFADFLALVFL